MTHAISHAMRNTPLQLTRIFFLPDDGSSSRELPPPRPPVHRINVWGCRMGRLQWARLFESLEARLDAEPNQPGVENPQRVSDRRIGCRRAGNRIGVPHVE